MVVSKSEEDCRPASGKDEKANQLREEEEEDEESEYEEQEELVLVRLQGVVQSEIGQLDLDKFKLLGAHTDKPILQVGGLMFQGRLEPTLGTAVFFKEDPEAGQAVADPVFSQRPDKWLRYTDKTHHTLQMKRVFIKRKWEELEERGSGDNVEEGAEITQADSEENLLNKSMTCANQQEDV